MELLKRAWRGKEESWIVFWIYGCIAGFLLFTVAGLIGWLVLKFAPAAYKTVSILLFPCWLSYLVWIVVSSWRCAFNTKTKLWGYVLRILIVVVPLIGLAGGVITGMKALKYLRCDRLYHDLQYRQAHPDRARECGYLDNKQH
ncbi:MAG: hypothetical protein ACAH80_15295 [Alphaproteobacteria bacterium]